MIIFKQVTVVKGRASQLPRFEAPPKLGTGRRSQQHPASPMVDDRVMSPNQGIYQSDTPATHRGCMVVVSPPSKEQPWLQKEKASGKKNNFEPYALVCHQLAVRPWSQACKTTLGHHWVCHWTDTTDLQEKWASIKFLHLPQLKRTIKVLRPNVGKECAFMG